MCPRKWENKYEPPDVLVVFSFIDFPVVLTETKRKHSMSKEWQKYLSGEYDSPPLEIDKIVKDIKLHKYEGSRYCVENYKGSPYILIKRIFSRGGDDYNEIDLQFRIFINEVEEHIKALRKCVEFVDNEKQQIEKTLGKTFIWRHW
jgi:hypothetical protein